MAAGESYEEFVQKFKPNLTTDDCYTPPLVYEAVAEWVAAEYGLDKSDFVRPFYPGGDYQSYDYPAGCVVVDNPPFSILSKIVQWYGVRGIRFFLFSPALTIFGNTQKAANVCALCAYCTITYENGAEVSTSFLTNLEPAGRIVRSAPTLWTAVKKANDEARKQKTVQMPKYTYPLELLTANDVNAFSRHGIEFSVDSSDVHFVRKLDSQAQDKKSVYGGGFLISERAAAERAAAERAAAERAAAERAAAERAAAERAAATKWTLSDRERAIIENMNTERR